MIQRRIFFSCLFSFLCLSLLSFFLFFPKDADRENYQKILEKRKRTLCSKAFPQDGLHQMREGVQKDLWVVNDQERLHFRLFSEHSDLALKKKEKLFELAENLQNIECWIQEKVIKEENRQLIRFFSSQEGVYRYPSHKFFSPKLFLSFFQVPGTELPDDLFSFSPYLQGMAHKVYFQLTEKVPAFEASHLHALYKLD
jgi:hypothetical protein